MRKFLILISALFCVFATPSARANEVCENEPCEMKATGGKLLGDCKDKKNYTDCTPTDQGADKGQCIAQSCAATLCKDNFYLYWAKINGKLQSMGRCYSKAQIQRLCEKQCKEKDCGIVIDVLPNWRGNNSVNRAYCGKNKSSSEERQPQQAPKQPENPTPTPDPAPKQPDPTVTIACTTTTGCSGLDYMNILDNILEEHFTTKYSDVWKDESGNFNTARLTSDSIAGVVLGTTGGIITSQVIKKNQLKRGFQDLKCVIGGQDVAAYGDEFSVGLK